MSIYTSSRALADRLISRFANEQTASIERFTLTPDGQGGFTETWSTVYSGLRCAVVPMSGNEVLDAQRLNYTATHNVYFYYEDCIDITSKDRIIFGSRTFIVRDPRNEAEANALLTVRCEEGAAG